MLRNIGNCYCESTHRLLQKYDKNAQKSAKKRKKAHYHAILFSNHARYRAKWTKKQIRKDEMIRKRT